MWFGVITLFPDMFQLLQTGITGRAIKENKLTLATWNPRDFATDAHRSVDDHPYGGGPGMVMMAEPLKAAIQSAKKAGKTAANNTSLKTIYLSPQGRLFNQKMAEELIQQQQAIIFVAGRYEGIDERVIEQEIDEEWSIGDYILTGGELAAMVIIDAAARLIPGVVGDQDSVTQDSITTGLLKYPQYTRPEIVAGANVPSVLLSGHHQQIKRWRLQQSLGKTWLKRRDLLEKLLEKRKLTKEERGLLDEFIAEHTNGSNKNS